VATPLKISLVIVGGILVLAGGLYTARHTLQRWFFSPTASHVQEGISGQNKVVTVVKDLAVPWDIAFLPAGDMLVTERPGTLLRISDASQKFVVTGVEQTSEGGLLGVAVHPNYSKNHWIYLYYTTTKNGGLSNVVERYTFNDDTLTDPQVILQGIPASNNHDGGRMSFGPDGLLYIATGDAGDESSAQDTTALSGKILRMTDDGHIPQDNPFKNAVYSYGHRNVQGLAWDQQGRLWATEHGRSGVSSGYDELNLIKKGGNYGWPVIQGNESRAGMITPVINSGPDETWAPSGLAYSNGSLFFAGLRGQALYEARLGKGSTISSLHAHLREEYGRLRAVAVYKDTLYISTSNTDGRGLPKPGDDKILRIGRSVFTD
jgi:glucose/arabinose dehydrogenase